ncbi:MAG: FtsX-like permease family protein [Bacteroidota bacterium]|nr:FtsX-like permease family protein [Bacteroidota bacterium]MDP4234448.1 FtsX-like permease family protein [Bacteroidota bacterium]MDP4288180.1 FtsX-like permease family protein [Bacteroidota bacterium]
MASVLFAVVLAVTMKSLQAGVFGHLVKNVVSFHSGYLQVHKRGYWDEQTLDNGLSMDSLIAQKIIAQPGVSSALPRIESFVLASSGTITQGALCVGTEAAGEDKLTRLRSNVTSGVYLSDSSHSALLSEGLARTLQLKVGDTLVLLGQGYQGVQAAGKFPVGGIAKFGSPALNESLVFLPLRQAQEFLTAEGIITTFALAINETRTPEQIQSSLQNSLGQTFEVMTWKEMMPDIATHIKADGTFYNIMIGILYFVISFGIFGTVLMMINERTYELGMLLAIGMKRRLIALMLLGETVCTSILGAIAGVLVSFPVVLYLQIHPIRFTGETARAYSEFGFEPVIPALLEVNIFITQALIVLSLSLVLGVYPVLCAHRLNVTTSLRRG